MVEKCGTGNNWILDFGLSSIVVFRVRVYFVDGVCEAGPAKGSAVSARDQTVFCWLAGK